MVDSAIIKKAIEDAGGPAKVGRQLGVSRAAVCQWVRNGVSAKRAEKVEKLTGVSRYILCPALQSGAEVTQAA